MILTWMRQNTAKSLKTEEFVWKKAEPQLALQGDTCLFHEEQTGCNLCDVILKHLWFTYMTVSETGRLGHSPHGAFKCVRALGMGPPPDSQNIDFGNALATDVYFVYTLFAGIFAYNIYNRRYCRPLLWNLAEYTGIMLTSLQWWGQMEGLSWKGAAYNWQAQALTVKIP